MAELKTQSPLPIRRRGRIGDPDSWRRWYRQILPAYWAFLFCSTHLPNLRIDTPIPQSDKVMHAGTFALLAFLFWRFYETFERPLSGRFVGWAAAWLGLYAVLDEYLQQFVGRGASVADGLADVTGVVVMLAILEWFRRRKRDRDFANEPLPTD